jgi:hypothetical protein
MRTIWQRIGIVLMAAILGLGAAVGVVWEGARAQAVAPFNLALDLHTPQHLAPEAEFEVNVSYQNTGAEAAPGPIQVKVGLPVGVSYVAAAGMGGAVLIPAAQTVGPKGETSLRFEMEALAPGATGHIFVTARVAADLAEGTTLDYTAAIEAAAQEDDLSDNRASFSSTVCDLGGSGMQAHTRQGAPGDVLTYTVRLRLAQRKGPGAGGQRQVNFEAEIPPQTEFLGWTGTISGTQTGSQLRWQGQLKAGEEATLQYRLGVRLNVAAGEAITQSAQLKWSGGQMRLEPEQVQIHMPDGAQLIGAGGHQWAGANGVQIGVPAGAVTDTARFEFRQMQAAQVGPGASAGQHFAHQAFALNAYRYGELHQFGQPISVTVPVSGTGAGRFQPETLRLWYRQGPGDAWQLGEPGQLQNGQLTFQTTHFTEFALFGTPMYAFQVGLPLVRR